MRDSDLLLAYDLGTGGIKASLFGLDGMPLENTFSQYDVSYPGNGFQEQRPDLWVEGMVSATKRLLGRSGVDPARVSALSISGHSLGCVPVDRDGRLLRETAPIWSDDRAKAQAEAFFREIDYPAWYLRTGNGFPAECYTLFKIMWYRDNEPEVYERAYKILGSKDYCNFRLTGRMATDPSYASGTGCYDLKNARYDEEYVRASGIRPELLPEILPSHAVVGELTREAAAMLGLTERVKVVLGGVDNSCMALGARCTQAGRAYISLGSSSWIAVTGSEPLVDAQRKPFVFAHVVDGLYMSATSVFSAGSSFRWVRDQLCPDIVERERRGEIADSYELLNEMAARSPIGANRLQFNPSLTSAAMIEKSKNIAGAFVGLRLEHSRGDLVRASMEGIVYNLYYALTVLIDCGFSPDEFLLVGGGAKSPFWRQMFADAFGMNILKSSVDQNAASLGAAALAAYGLGYWRDFRPADGAHALEGISRPDPARTAEYRKHYQWSRRIADWLSDAGDMLAEGR